MRFAAVERPSRAPLRRVRDRTWTTRCVAGVAGGKSTPRDESRLLNRTLLGTYGYMPIEQYEARAQPQSDFCALGMTLVYVLCQKEPTKISRRSTKLEFRSHVNVSEGFAQVLERMIEPAPEDRFASADELLDALDGASDVVVYQPQQVVAAAGSPVAMRVMFVGISAMLLVILAFLFLLAPA